MMTVKPFVYLQRVKGSVSYWFKLVLYQNFKQNKQKDHSEGAHIVMWTIQQPWNIVILFFRKTNGWGL